MDELAELPEYAKRFLTTTVVADPLSDLLDDMAAIAVYWQKRRNQGTTPRAIQGAMVLIAQDVVAQETITRAAAEIGRNMP